MASKNVWNEVKRRVLMGMILPTMLDGAENWIISSKMLAELNSAYNIFIRSCLRMTTHTQRTYNITTTQLLKKMEMNDLQYYIDWKILGYIGHVVRMNTQRIPYQMLEAYLPGPRKIGAPCKTHKKQIVQCLLRKQISQETWKTDALERNEWRNMIKNVIPTKIQINTKPSWHSNPREILDCHVEKKYGSKYYVGIIVSLDIDSITHEQLWRVDYDDGDSADYNRGQIQKILCLDEMHVF